MTTDDSKNADRELVLKESEVLATIANKTRELGEAEQHVARLRADIEAYRALLTFFPKRENPAQTLSIREMALDVLQAASRPMGVREIIDGIAERFGASVARTSLSPILKKMEGRGLVEHVGTTWIEKRKGPSAPTDGPTGDGRSSGNSLEPHEHEEGNITMK